MKAIPWRDQATFVRINSASIQDGGRVIVAEGPLYHLLDMADALAPDELGRHFIALPDRRTPPFRFEGEAIRSLLGRLDRPGALRQLHQREATFAKR